MANIKIKRGAGVPTGLTFGELAFDTTNKRLYIGVTGSSALLANTDGGVASFNGLTGAVGLTNGSGIGLSVSGNTLTVSNTGVLSIDGGTGAITNVARTNVNNNFTASQSISAFGGSLTVTDTDTQSYITLDPANIRVSFSDPFGSGTMLSGGAVPAFTTATVTLPAYTTTLAGLTGTQTFTGINTFSSLANFSAGISSAGGTFSALTRFTAGISASTGITLTGSLIMPSNVNNYVSLDAQTVYLGDINYSYDNAHIEILQDPAIYLYGGGSIPVIISGNSIDTNGGSINLGNLTINSSQGSNNQVLTSTGSGITWATISGSGGISRTISTITGSTTAGSAASTDYVYNGNTTGNITLTMPTAASNTNRYTIKNSNTGVLSIYTTSSQTIDGVTFYNLNKQYQAIDLLSDNSNWFIV